MPISWRGPAIGLPPTSHNSRAGPLAKQPLHLHGPLDVVEPQLHQLDTVFRKKAVLGDHVSMASTADTHADHGFGFLSKDGGLRSDETDGRVLDW